MTPLKEGSKIPSILILTILYLSTEKYFDKHPKTFQYAFKCNCPYNSLNVLDLIVSISCIPFEFSLKIWTTLGTIAEGYLSSKLSAPSSKLLSENISTDYSVLSTYGMASLP